MKFIIYVAVYFQLIAVLLCKPNVLFLIIDDLKPNLGCYGYKNALTPNIDKLASKSFVFENAFAQQALCAPSRSSLLTSRRPDSLHVYDFYHYWRNTGGNFTTLPQYFKENGYYTHSIGKVFHPGVSSNWSDDMPYSWSVKPVHPNSETYENNKLCPNSDGTLGKNLLCPVWVPSQPGGTLPDMEIQNFALDFLEYEKNITEGKPYFLAIGFRKPHIPFRIPEKYLEMHPLSEVKLAPNHFRPPLMPIVAWNPFNDVRKRDDVEKLNISFPFGEIPDDFQKRIIQHYDASVTYIDDLVGEIIDKVIGENTVIVLTSDHGWSLGEHGEFAKYSNFDVATRVPLLIHVPKLSEYEVRVQEPIELVDLFPTLVDLTQVAAPLTTCSNKNKQMLCTEGRSLISLMVNQNQTVTNVQRSAVFSQYPRPGSFPTHQPNSDSPKLNEIKIMGYSIRTRRYRYTEWVEFDKYTFKPNWTNTYGTELYDHHIDRQENLNLIDHIELKDIANRLKKRLILGWRDVSH